MAHRIWKETKQEPGTAGPGNMIGCCSVSFSFLWSILSTSTVEFSIPNMSYNNMEQRHLYQFLSAFGNYSTYLGKD